LQRRLIPLRARLGRLLRRGQESPEGKAAALCRELAKSAFQKLVERKLRQMSEQPRQRNAA
jgi:hypothetical protein